MEKEELEKLIEKYSRLGDRFEFNGDEKYVFYRDVSEYIEDNIDIFLDDDLYETEQDVIDSVKEIFAESDLYYDDEYLVNNLF